VFTRGLQAEGKVGICLVASVGVRIGGFGVKHKGCTQRVRLAYVLLLV
jgi:hypothetical protein